MKYLILIGYFTSIVFCCFYPSQEDLLHLIGLFGTSFLCYYLLVKRSDYKFKHLLILALGIRFILLFSFPNLSDDLYRFIWDGSLIHKGINPFEFLPSEYLNLADDAYLKYLFPLLNSPEYYTVYPPIAQLIFYISSWPIIEDPWFSSIIIKALLFGAEALTMLFGMKLMRLIKLPERNILWYALNPLVIVEIIGNVHFEGFMVCFFVLFLYSLKKNKIGPSALYISLAICVKLIPLLFLPYFVFNWKIKRSAYFYSVIALIILFLFSPILFQISGFGNSLDLYFRKFEFNASIYYLFRTLGEWIYGYNYISLIGPCLALTVFFTVMYKAYDAGQEFLDFVNFCMVALTIFLILSTTVHPWYLCLGVLLSCFTKSKYFILWSGLAILSYAKYYGNEPLYYALISVEYLGLFSYLAWEIHRMHEKLD